MKRIFSQLLFSRIETSKILIESQHQQVSFLHIYVFTLLKLAVPTDSVQGFLIPRRIQMQIHRSDYLFHKQRIYTYTLSNIQHPKVLYARALSRNFNIYGGWCTVPIGISKEKLFNNNDNNHNKNFIIINNIRK